MWGYGYGYGMEAENTWPITTTTTTTTDQLSRMSGWKWYRHHCTGRRLTRTGAFLILLLFSPIILPLLCLCFPFICLITVLLHLVPVKWRFRWGDRDRHGARSIVRCKEASGPTEARAGLLERYLEDQLGLVCDACAESVD